MAFLHELYTHRRIDQWETMEFVLDARADGATKLRDAVKSLLFCLIIHQPEKVDTLEVIGLNNVAPPLYSAKCLCGCNMHLIVSKMIQTSFLNETFAQYRKARSSLSGRIVSR